MRTPVSKESVALGIRVENVTMTYDGVDVLKDVSVDIEDGSFLTLLGGLGAGKTTLLRIMAGIDKPTRGRVYFNGKDVTREPVQKLPVAMVYQQFINYPSMTVYDNIASPMLAGRGPKPGKDELDRKVRQYAELLGLTAVLSHYPEEVSGGQRQRTAIARALIKEATFTFLDEPLANLDYKLREELRGELKNILSDKGGVVVYATPEPVDALSMATHVGYMQDGEILQYGDLESVYRYPGLADVGRYFSYPTMNILPGRCVKDDGRTFIHLADELAVEVSHFSDKLARGEYLVGIRAYNLYTKRVRDDLVHLTAEVALSETLGSDTELHCTFHDKPMVVLEQEVARYHLGEQVDLYLDPNRLFLFDTDTRELVVKTFVE